MGTPPPRTPRRTPFAKKKTQHNLTAGDWKAGISACSRHIWSDYSSAWLYVHEEDGIGHTQAKHLPYTNNDAILMAAAKKMLWALRSANAAIQSLSEHALGYEMNRGTGVVEYYYRDELLDQIEKALPKFQEDEEPEENEMVKTLILLDESFKDDQSKLILSRSAEDPNLVEIDIDGDTTVSLTFKELHEALKFLKGESVIR